MDDEAKITLKRTINAPAEEIFAAWTDPALLEQWQADRAEFEAFEGGTFRFESEDDETPDRKSPDQETPPGEATSVVETV